METKSILVWVILVFVILGAIWIIWYFASTTQVPNTTTTNTAQQNTQQKPAQIDSTNTAIDNSLSTIDSQIKNLDTDASNIDTSITGM
jgi:peptidoglycan hydrolase CwlO-like protein